jgi:hypothetical protein
MPERYGTKSGSGVGDRTFLWEWTIARMEDHKRLYALIVRNPGTTANPTPLPGLTTRANARRHPPSGLLTYQFLKRHPHLEAVATVKSAGEINTPNCSHQMITLA